MSGDVGRFLAEGGAVVGGGAVLAATVGFLAGSIAREFRPEIDPDAWARECGFFGGLAGLVIFLDGA